MTTAVDLSQQQLELLKELTKQQDSAAALRTAVTEYIRYAKRMRLKELSGRVEMVDNWQELEQREIDAQYGQPGPD